MDTEDHEKFHDFVGGYSLTLAIIGVPANLLTHVVCIKLPLRNVPTFVIISLLSFFDAVSLCFWNIDHFLHQFFDYIQEDLSLEMCRLVTFLQCVALQTSAWLLVTMTIERYLSVHVKSWRTAYFSVKKAAIVTASVIILVVVINFHLLFTVNYDLDKNATILGECVTSEIYLSWMQVHIWLYSIVPFILLLVSNILLIRKLFFSKKHQNVVISNDSKNKRKATGVTVICLTTMFLILTLPQTFTRGYFLTKLSATPAGLSIIFACDTLAFGYHGLNFFILYFSNKKFAQEIKVVFGLQRRSATVTTFEATRQ